MVKSFQSYKILYPNMHICVRRFIFTVSRLRITVYSELRGQEKTCNGYLEYQFLHACQYQILQKQN